MSASANAAVELERRIADGSARVCVIGLGYVGLPLALEFARAGFSVTGLERDEHRIAELSAGRSYLGDVDSELLAEQVRAGRLSASSDATLLAEADAVIICVPTPLSKTRDPDLSFVLSASEEIARHLHPGELVVLESTTYPGTTEELIMPTLAASSLQPGRDFYLAFSPERVDPANRRWGIRNTPKIIGGVTPDCGRLAAALYARIIDTVVPVSSPRAAEMVKLLENTFRSVNIALVNEIALMCDRLDLNVWEVIEAAATKPFGFMPFYPGPGLGGHCIPIDPMYLSWKLKTLNYRARFIELASEVNSEMPLYVYRRISDALNRERKAVNGASVLVVGVSYKPDVSDVRESPALDIMRLLFEKGAQLCYHDRHVPRLAVDGVTLESDPDLLKAASKADCTVIVTNHSGIDYPELVEHSKLVIDTRNATRGLTAPHIVRL